MFASIDIHVVRHPLDSGLQLLETLKSLARGTVVDDDNNTTEPSLSGLLLACAERMMMDGSGRRVLGDAFHLLSSTLKS